VTKKEKERFKDSYAYTYTAGFGAVCGGKSCFVIQVLQPPTRSYLSGERVNLATIPGDCGLPSPSCPRETGGLGGENGVSPPDSGSLDLTVMTNSTQTALAMDEGEYTKILTKAKTPGKRRKQRILRVRRGDDEIIITEDDLKDSDLLIADLTGDFDGETTRIWRMANGEVREPRKEMNMEKIRDCAYRYAYLMDEKRLVFHGEDERGNRYLRFEKMAHMLDIRYWRGLRVRLSRIRLKGMGITLTLRCDSRESVYNDRKRISSCWNRMRSFLQRLLGEFEYFIMTEYGEDNGMVHLHIFIKGIEPPRHVKEFRDLYMAISDAWYGITGDSYKVWISRMKQHADRYFMKYIIKNTQKEFTDSLILAWSCGMRVWTCSRGFWDSYVSHALDEFDVVVDDTAVGIEWELLGVIEVQDDTMRQYDSVIWVLRAEAKNDHG